MPVYTETEELSRLKREIKNQMLTELVDTQLTDELLHQRIDALLFHRSELSLKTKLYLRNAIFNSFRRLDVLSELLDDREVTEIMINSDAEIFLERNGRMQRWEKQSVDSLIQKLVCKLGIHKLSEHLIFDFPFKTGEFFGLSVYGHGLPRFVG